MYPHSHRPILRGEFKMKVIRNCADVLGFEFNYYVQNVHRMSEEVHLIGNYLVEYFNDCCHGELFKVKRLIEVDYDGISLCEWEQVFAINPNKPMEFKLEAVKADGELKNLLNRLMRGCI